MTFAFQPATNKIPHAYIPAQHFPRHTASPKNMPMKTNDHLPCAARSKFLPTGRSAPRYGNGVSINFVDQGLDGHLSFADPPVLPVLLSGGRQQGVLFDSPVPGAVGRSGPFTPSRWNRILWRVSKQRPSLLGKWGWIRQSAKTPWHCEKKNITIP